jgi:poly(3-hydroxybutyrate) depolymerase
MVVGYQYIGIKYWEGPMFRILMAVCLIVLVVGSVFGQLPDYVRSHHLDLDGHGYLVEFPQRGFSQTEVPLIVMLHGGGGNSDGYNMNSRMFMLLEENDAVILFPQGELDGYTWVPSDRYWIWDIVTDLMSKMEIHFPGHVIDTSRIYAVGSSYGGWMAHALGYLESEHYAAIATIGGGWPGNQFDSGGPPANQVGVIMFHNRWDNVVRIGQSSADAAEAWSEWNGAPDYFRNRDNSDYWLHTFSRDNTEWVRLYEIRTRIRGTSNHTWPHMDTYGIEPVVEIWPFFMQFQRGDIASDGEGEVLVPHTSDLLMTAYPNPFNATGMVTLQLPETGQVVVTVHNALGRQVSTLMDGNLSSGMHQFTIDGTEMASGVYFVSAVVEGHGSLMQKVVLVR